MEAPGEPGSVHVLQRHLVGLQKKRHFYFQLQNRVDKPRCGGTSHVQTCAVWEFSPRGSATVSLVLLTQEPAPPFPQPPRRAAQHNERTSGTVRRLRSDLRRLEHGPDGKIIKVYLFLASQFPRGEFMFQLPA